MALPWDPRGQAPSSLGLSCSGCTQTGSLNSKTEALIQLTSNSPWS
ncbi:rCG30624 [Rattus norvegicus]|uniref:RCG30624 n=1 Tax=Rattus norvegicus TaxID=10116 RepID=A6ITU8_RAT|nr:rCG30624 [Rattus norvegicus]